MKPAFFLPADPMARCLRCAWLGRVEDLVDDDRCPSCGSFRTVPTEPAPDETPSGPAVSGQEAAL